MKKQAINLNPFDAWQGLKEDPVIGAAMTLGGYVPILGGFVGAGDAFNHLYRGNLAQAGLSAIQAAAGFLPGGRPGTKGLAARLASKGRLGAAAAKVVPYIAPRAADKVTNMHYMASMIPAAIAQTTDAVRQMDRPVYQKQMKEQEAMMRDFNEWRRHKQTLQQIGQQPDQVKEGAAIPTASPVLPPTYGQMAGTSFGVAKNIAPYMLAANLGGHMLPSFYKDDVPGMAQGALEGTGATTGSLGGLILGSLGGMALARSMGHQLGMDPAFASQIGAALGGVGGGLLGHRAGRAAVEKLTEGGESSRFPKYGAAAIPRSQWRSPADLLRKAIGGGPPNFQADPIGNVGHHLGTLGGKVSQGVGWLGNKTTALGDPRAGQILGSVAQTLGRYPKTVGSVAVAIPSLLALRYLLNRGTTSQPAEKQAAKRPEQRQKLKSKEISNQIIAGGGNPNDPGGYINAMNQARRRKPATPAATPLVEPPAAAVPPPAAPITPPAAAPAPKNYPMVPVSNKPMLPATIPGPAQPGIFERMGAHPLVQQVKNFAGTTKGKAALAAALAAAAAGTYYMGRRRRQKEDEAAQAEMAGAA